MIDDILDYISSYDEVRVVLGVPLSELTDEALALLVFRNHLYMALEGITGTYPTGDANGDRSLTDIFGSLSETDSMYALIQLYSIYSVAGCAARSLPMFAYKTKADGKSTLTRHSSESVYEDTQAGIGRALAGFTGLIRELLGETFTEGDLLTAVAPITDAITGA